MQGSEAEPYELVVSLDPVTISCTCRAALRGLPCKHRKSILSGQVEIPEDPEMMEKINAIAEAVRKSDLPRYLQEYEDAKGHLGLKKEASEKVFKKYMDTVIDSALKKGTQKAAQKASDNLDKALQDCVNAATEIEALRQTLRTVFIMPKESPANRLARQAARN